MHTPTGYARDATCCYRVCVIKNIGCASSGHDKTHDVRVGDFFLACDDHGET